MIRQGSNLPTPAYGSSLRGNQRQQGALVKDIPFEDITPSPRYNRLEKMPVRLSGKMGGQEPPPISQSRAQTGAQRIRELQQSNRNSYKGSY